ncbi:MAG: hypothetical protein WCJ49_00615 [Deltaproteobacteria bacterium]
MDKTKDFFNEMSSFINGAGLQIPPPVFVTHRGVIENFVEGKTLSISFPLLKEQENPVGQTLGGYLPLFFDLTFGPFSYTLAKCPATSLDINTQFLRPLSTKDNRVTITVEKVHESKSYLILYGYAYNQNGDLIATANTRMKKMMTNK